jgi:hypothetical protein
MSLFPAWLRTNTVDCGCAMKISVQVRKGISGEEQHQAMEWKVPVCHMPVHHNTPLTTKPFGGGNGACEAGFSTQPPKDHSQCKSRAGYPTTNPVVNSSQASMTAVIQSSFQLYKCTYVTKCVGKLWITPYMAALGNLGTSKVRVSTGSCTYPEDVDSSFLWNFGTYLPVYTASHLRTRCRWTS